MANTPLKEHRLALERWRAAYMRYLEDGDAAWRSHPDLVALTPAAEVALEAAHAGTTRAPMASGEMGHGLANTMDFNERYRQRMNTARAAGSVVRTAELQATFGLGDDQSATNSEGTTTNPTRREIAPDEAMRAAFERLPKYVTRAIERLDAEDGSGS